MSRSMLFRATLMALLMGVLPFVHAATAPVVAVDQQQFDEQRQVILQQLDDPAEYDWLKQRDRQKVRSHLDRMFDLLGNAEDSMALRSDQRNELYNLQEQVNGLLTKVRQDDRVTCRREHSVGSHRPATRCATALERERAANHARAEMLNSLQRGQVKDL